MCSAVEPCRTRTLSLGMKNLLSEKHVTMGFESLGIWKRLCVHGLLHVEQLRELLSV